MKNNSEMEKNKLNQLDFNNETFVNKINETSDLILMAKNILKKY